MSSPSNCENSMMKENRNREKKQLTEKEKVHEIMKRYSKPEMESINAKLRELFGNTITREELLTIAHVLKNNIPECTKITREATRVKEVLKTWFIDNMDKIEEPMKKKLKLIYNDENKNKNKSSPIKRPKSAKLKFENIVTKIPDSTLTVENNGDDINCNNTTQHSELYMEHFTNNLPLNSENSNKNHLQMVHNIKIFGYNNDNSLDQQSIQNSETSITDQTAPVQDKNQDNDDAKVISYDFSDFTSEFMEYLERNNVCI